MTLEYYDQSTTFENLYILSFVLCKLFNKYIDTAVYSNFLSKTVNCKPSFIIYFTVLSLLTDKVVEICLIKNYTKIIYLKPINEIYIQQFIYKLEFSY